MNDNLREHLDHEAGCFDNEFQAAFTLSRLETDLDPDRRRIDGDLSCGLFVVVQHGLVCCRITDAILGRKRVHIKSFIGRRAAEAYAAEIGQHDYDEVSTEVLPFRR